jgi:hypothetical protein
MHADEAGDADALLAAGAARPRGDDGDVIAPVDDRDAGESRSKPRRSSSPSSGRMWRKRTRVPSLSACSSLNSGPVSGTARS